MKIIKKENRYDIVDDNVSVGWIERFENPFHQTNVYLKLHLKSYKKKYVDIFNPIAEIEKRPLQIMLSASEEKKIHFIESAGFQCMRRCYEVDFTIDDLVKREYKDMDVYYCDKNNKFYMKYAIMIYKHYQNTHTDINALTASFEEFMKILPDTIFYYHENVIFFEKNEIAYVYLKDEDSTSFAYKVVSRLFEENKHIIMECDDVDSSAMKLLSLFKADKESSYNTYIRRKHE